jgi:predicted nucleic acid-binding protein
MSKNLVDSCGWLEYFADSGNAGFFAPAIEDTKNLIIPSLCIADSVVYATAIAHDALLWTQDRHFENLLSVKYATK